MTDARTTAFSKTEELEAMQLCYAIRHVVELRAGHARDVARRQLATDAAQLDTHFAHLYRQRAPDARPRPAAVIELAVAFLDDALSLAHLAQRDPHTHVLLLQLLQGGAQEAELVFSSPLPADDAFMMLGTD